MRMPSAKLGLSLITAATLAGCGGGGDFREVNEADLAPVPEEHHQHAAPHGGLLVEVGNHEYNAEFVVSNTDPKLVIYILDAHAEGPVVINVDAIKFVLEGAEAAPLTLKAVPKEGETEGTASQFEIDGALPENIKSSRDLHGELTLNIKDKEYQVHVEPGGHDHDHDHDHDK